MGQVDDYQNAEEAVEQMKEEAAARTRAALQSVFNETPIDETAGLVVEQRNLALGDISTGSNVRQSLPDVEDLAKSITQKGLQTPLRVRPQDETWVLISGHRRLAALQLIANGDESYSVRCEVIDADERDVVALQLAENDHRPLPERDWARGIRLLMHHYPDRSASETAKSLGVPVGKVNKYMRLLDLPSEVHARVESGDLSFSSADMIRKAQARGDLEEVAAVELAEAVVAGDTTNAQLKQQLTKPRKVKEPTIDEEDEWFFSDDDAERPALGSPHSANHQITISNPVVAVDAAPAPQIKEEDEIVYNSSAGTEPHPDDELLRWLLAHVVSTALSDARVKRLCTDRQHVQEWVDCLPHGVIYSQLMAAGKDAMNASVSPTREL